MTYRKLLPFAFIALFACSSTPQPTASAPAAPKEIPASALEEHPGESFAEAVVVPPGSPNEGIDYQNEWMYKRYGAFRRQSAGMVSRDGGRHFDVIVIETRDHATHTVYFDMTDLLNALYVNKK